jgi:hypothetical protein
MKEKEGQQHFDSHSRQPACESDMSDGDEDECCEPASDEEILSELEKMDNGVDFIQKSRMFEDPTQQEVMDDLNKTRANTAEERHILNEIILRFSEPVRYKIKFYQIAVLMYIDHVLSLFINKYMYFRVKMEKLPEQTNLKILKFRETQMRLDLFSKKNLERTRLLVYKLNLKAENGLDKLQEMHHHCVTHADTPELFCEPYIHKGFRPINMPYSYYVKSLFTKHNESINAWSHYIGAMYTTYCAFHYNFTDP